MHKQQQHHNNTQQHIRRERHTHNSDSLQTHTLTADSHTHIAHSISSVRHIFDHLWKSCPSIIIKIRQRCPQKQRPRKRKQRKKRRLSSLNNKQKSTPTYLWQRPLCLSTRTHAQFLNCPNFLRYITSLELLNWTMVEDWLLTALRDTSSASLVVYTSWPR